MDILYIAGVVLFVLMAWAIHVVVRYSRKRKLSPAQLTYLVGLLKKIKKNPDPKSQIIDIDKLYHKILKELQYEGTFGEILKKEPNEIGDLQKVWRLHKLRNNLVHDFDTHEDSWLQKNSTSYQQEINKLLTRIS